VRTSRTTLMLAAIMVLLGLAVIIRTVAAGVGGGLGLLMGGLLVGAGLLRIYLDRARRR